MEVIVKIEGFDDIFVDADEKTTGADIRARVDEKRDEIEVDFTPSYRFVCERTGRIVHDEEHVAECEGMIELDEEESVGGSDKDVGALQDEDGDEEKVKSDSSGNESPKEEEKAEAKAPAEAAGAESDVEKKPEEGDDEEAKVKSDSTEEEHKYLKRKADLLVDLLDRCKQAEQVNMPFIRTEIMHLMRMERVPAGMKIPEDGSRLPRKRRLVLQIQEGISVYLHTKRDGYLSVSCLGSDDLKYLRERFNKYVKCENLHDLQLQKLSDKKELKAEDDELTLDELGIGDGASIVATRRGEGNQRIIFNFSIAIDMKVDFADQVRTIAGQLVRRHAPDLFNVCFNFWYRGSVIDADSESEQILGDEILGKEPMRVLIIMDPTLDYKIDKSPQLRMLRYPHRKLEPEDVPEFVREMDTKTSGPYITAVQTASVARKTVDTAGNADSNRNGDAKQKENNYREIRLAVNKRALRRLTILVERTLPEHLVDPVTHELTEANIPMPHEGPLTLPDLTLSTTLGELRMILFERTKELPAEQTLRINGQLLTCEYDHKSLRELNLDAVRTIYMEPSMTVKVKYQDTVSDLRFPSRLTQFATIIHEIEKEHGIPREECYLEYQGVCALPQSYLSEYRLKNNDELKLIPAFTINFWHDIYLYRKSVWEHTPPMEIFKDIATETKIDPEALIITRSGKLDKMFPKHKASIGKCGIKEADEFDVYTREEYEKKKQQKESEQKGKDDDSEAPEHAKGQFVIFDPSKSSSSSSSDEGLKIFGERYLKSKPDDDDDDCGGDSDSSSDEDPEDDN